MRVIGIIFCLVMLSGFSRGNTTLSGPTTSLDYYLNLFTSVEGESGMTDRSFSEFVNRLESKRSSFRDDRAFVHHIFQKSHQKFLRNFEQYAPFRDMFGVGNYNCLTGTALYALLLEHFQIEYSIVETNYHVFVLVNTKKGKVLLEATDPVHGFTSGSGEIEKRIEGYRKNQIQQTTTTDKKYYSFSFDLFNEVKLEQLLGLLHYNTAIVDYNNDKLQSAITHLDQALALYNSPRIEEFSRVITLSVVESSLSTSMKEYYIKRLHSIRKKHIMMTASAKAN
jgi:hypothetical protein